MTLMVRKCIFTFFEVFLVGSCFRTSPTLINGMVVFRYLSLITLVDLLQTGAQSEGGMLINKPI